MTTNGVRAAIYLRVSRDDQTTENQRLVLARVAEHRGWLIVQTYEDQGISGAKGRDQRPAFDAMLKDAVRRRYDILLVWSIDRLGRSVLHVANALAELDAAGIRLYCDQQGIDSSTPMGRAMIQMASVFGEQERSMLRAKVLAGLDRVRQQGKRLGRPKVENAIRMHLSAGKGILKVAALVGVGSGTVQRVKRDMAEQLQEGPNRRTARNLRRNGASMLGSSVRPAGPVRLTHQGRCRVPRPRARPPAGSPQAYPSPDDRCSGRSCCGATADDLWTC